eukprot:255732_1
MMKLFLLSTLLFVGIHATKVTTITCTASTTCSGDSCNTVTGDLPSGCQNAAGVTGSATYTCSGGEYTITTYTASDDCTGDNTPISVKTGECIATDPMSVKIDCDSALTVNLFYVGIMVLIASLLQ